MALVIYSQWEDIRAFHWDLKPGWLGLSVAGLIVALLSGPWGWYWILRALREHIPFRKTFRVWTLSSVAKYIPGGVWTFVGRAALAKNQGVSMSSLTISMFLEHVLLTLSSLTVGIPILIKSASIQLHPVIATVVFVSLAATVHPRVLSVLSRLPGRIGKKMSTISFPSVGRLLALYLYYLCHWVLFAAAFLCLVNAIYPAPTDSYMALGSALAIGFFLSFVLLIFPSGIGVRETALYVLLLPFLPSPVCLAVAIGSRLWLMSGELLVILIVLLSSRFDQNVQTG